MYLVSVYVDIRIVNRFELALNWHETWLVKCKGAGFAQK